MGARSHMQPHAYQGARPAAPACPAGRQLCARQRGRAPPPAPPRDAAFAQGLSRVAEWVAAGARNAMCLICLGSIKPAEAVWHCGDSCFAVFHLPCMQARLDGRGAQGGEGRAASERSNGTRAPAPAPCSWLGAASTVAFKTQPLVPDPGMLACCTVAPASPSLSPQDWARNQLDAAALRAANAAGGAPPPRAALAFGCPKCRCEYPAARVPRAYLCFCGKVESPTWDP